MGHVKSKVTLETFKESGKWYDEIVYLSELDAWEVPELKKEATAKAQKDMDFVMTAESIHGPGMTKTLVIITK